MTIDDKLTYIKGCCFDVDACRDCKLTVGQTCPIKLWQEWTDEEIETAYAILHDEVNFVKANPDDEVKSGDDVDRYEVHRKICDKLNDTYRKKNADYGNSFGNGFEEYGLIMPAIRLEDKFMRFKRLALGGKQNVTSESIKDTLLDLANYAIMTLVEMEGDNDN